MWKFIAFILITLICICIAVIPETAMYFLWQMVNPQTELGKILVLGIFWCGGFVFCIMFALFGFLLWVAGMEQL